MIVKKEKNSAEKILDEIYQILISMDKIQYTEFIAFWKVLDISYSAFKKMPGQKSVLKNILQFYCKKRRKLYDKLGYSNVTVQALYDMGTSRRKGVSSINKLLAMLKIIFKEDVYHAKDI